MKENRNGRIARDLIQQFLEQDKEVVRDAITSGRCLTVALYEHEDMLFLYMEALEDNMENL